MSEHKDNAKGFLEVAQRISRDTQQPTATLLAALAQAEATLALAEELRTANLIALGSVSAAHATHDPGSLLRRAWEELKS